MAPSAPQRSQSGRVSAWRKKKAPDARMLEGAGSEAKGHEAFVKDNGSGPRFIPPDVPAVAGPGSPRSRRGSLDDRGDLAAQNKNSTALAQEREAAGLSMSCARLLGAPGHRVAFATHGLVASLTAWENSFLRL